jgi:RND family efflux transporter MFP subunit
MKQSLRTRLEKISLVLVVLSFVLLQACGNKPEENAGKDKTNYIDTISVEAAKVEVKELKVSKTFSGTLEGEDQANIYSKIPERITEIKIKVGDYVKSGSILFVLDKGGASSQFFQAQAVYLNSQKDLERMKALFSEGAVSRQALDGAQTGYDVAKANFDAAKSTVELTTPISGIVTSLNVSVGEMANPGFVLATIANTGRMKALFNAGENDVANIFVGQPAEIYSELMPELKQSGKIIQLSRSADIQSRTFEMKALFSNTKEKWFKPGMFCRVNVDLKTKKNAMTIPLAALVTSNNSSGVYIINNDKVSFKEVTIGIADKNTVEILSGLSAGDNIVTLGMNNLKDGTIVRVTNK